MSVYDPGNALLDNPLIGVPSLPPAFQDVSALDMTVYFPLVNLSQGTSVIQSSSLQWVLIRVALADQATGLPVIASNYPVSIAITQADPVPGDYLPASWLIRTVLPASSYTSAVAINQVDPVQAILPSFSLIPNVAPAGDYARLLIGPVRGLSLAVGKWRVYVQIAISGGTFQVHSLGMLTVE